MARLLLIPLLRMPPYLKGVAWLRLQLYDLIKVRTRHLIHNRATAKVPKSGASARGSWFHL